METSPASERDEEHDLSKHKDGEESTIEIEQSLSATEDSVSAMQTNDKGIDEVAIDKNIDSKCEALDEVVGLDNVQGELTQTEDKGIDEVEIDKNVDSKCEAPDEVAGMENVQGEFTQTEDKGIDEVEIDKNIDSKCEAPDEVAGMENVQGEFTQTEDKGIDEVEIDKNIDSKCEALDEVVGMENVQGELTQTEDKGIDEVAIDKNIDSKREVRDEVVGMENVQGALVQTKDKGIDEVAIDKNIDSKCEVCDEVVGMENVQGELMQTKDKGIDEVAIDKNIDSKCEARDEVVGKENVGGELHHELETKLDLESERVVENSDEIVRNDDSNEKMEEDKIGESESSSEDSESDGEGSCSKVQIRRNQTIGEIIGEDEASEPIFDGTEVPGIEKSGSMSNRSMDNDSESQGVVDRAWALRNFVKEKGVVAVTCVLRHFSARKDEECSSTSINKTRDDSNSNKDNEVKEIPEKPLGRTSWSLFNYIKISRDADAQIKTELVENVVGESTLDVVIKGRIILYTRLDCKECKEARLFFFMKRLRYVEINVDVYPGRKLELEKIAGSSAVPKVFFNSTLIGGLNELRELDESGKFDEKIEYLKAESPSLKGPLPPLSGEDDVSSNGTVDELALIVRKMKESIVVKDRFCKMRRLTNCFLGSEAVDFLSEDQYLEREEAVEFGRKLASKLFFQHVLEENLFEDGNHLYRFLDDDPVVATQCHNVARGIIEVKPKTITDIASRLRFLSFAILEAYVSEDGKHVDYRSTHGSEEFARYLRIVEELQRVEVQNLAREEKLAFFINLYNMMSIHAILVCGHPVGALERRKLLGDFKYVIGGDTYSLSAIQNGILRGNQRPPYNLMNPFGAKDKRTKVSLPYLEPLIHFALVCGTRSGPALRCYSPGNVDQELMEAARSFLREGGLVIDLNNNSASVSMILKWFNTDFGKDEEEVMRHASNYLKPEDSQALLEMLASSQLKVLYQTYDWGLNC